MESSLNTLVVAIPGQSDVCWAKLEYCSNRLSRSSSLADSCVGNLLLISSFEVMVSGVSFTVVSNDFMSSGELSVFIFKLHFSPIFPRKCLMVLMLNDMS